MNGFKWINKTVAVLRVYKRQHQLTDEMLTDQLEQNWTMPVWSSILMTRHSVFGVQRTSTKKRKTIILGNKSDDVYLKKIGCLLFLPEIHNMWFRWWNGYSCKILCKHRFIFFLIVFLISRNFFPLVRRSRTRRVDECQRRKVKTTNENLLEMSDLEIGLVYPVLWPRSTPAAHFCWNGSRHEQALNLMDDNEKRRFGWSTLVEAKQAVEMAFRIGVLIGGTIVRYVQ